MSLCQFSPARRTPIGQAVLCRVGNHYNLWAAGHAPPLAEDVEFDLTKAAGEGDLLWGRNSLVTEENDGVSIN